MNEITATPALSPTLSNRLTRYTWLIILLLALGASVWAYWAWTAPPPPLLSTARTAATTISLRTLEERYGIRFRLLGVTAAGGMVDLRYKIMDKTKAAALAEDLNKINLIAENGATLTLSQSMNHATRLENGVINFHFFANTGNAVKPGRPVTIEIGPVRLEAINAQ